MFKTILVPVDLSEVEVARPAIEKATALAGVSGGTVALVYVRSILPVTFMEYVPPSFDEEQQGDAEKRLAELAATLHVPGGAVTTAVRMGAVYNEVLAEAKKIGADLIVVGSHRPGMATYLLGSNASTIVRHAESSVLVVREPAKK
ncbi:universal stress protein UspA [Alsobacter metallidurans]|uniref:Universal stress protein n=1 Tax=Alsobacter metallidurans TaxID=340221 RepID=A0A917I8Q5_9HYPH|nr:universal stress protein [Alsobacter metallidurans]GGH26641.1 universal stress protein UspA [Alsobacter metallidurans]